MIASSRPAIQVVIKSPYGVHTEIAVLHIMWLYHDIGIFALRLGVVKRHMRFWMLIDGLASRLKFISGDCLTCFNEFNPDPNLRLKRSP